MCAEKDGAGRLEAEPAGLRGVKTIVAVGAGKGGVGKSTIAVHLAVGLRRTGATVGLLDADVYGPSLGRMMGIEGRAGQVAGEHCILPFEAAGLKVMTLANFVPADQAMIWRGPMVHGAVRQLLADVAWGELDYLVVDLPPGTGDAPLTLAQTAGVAGAVVVSTPQALALADAIRAAQMYQRLGIHVLGFVENMSYFVCPHCGHEHDIFGRGGAARAAERLGVPVLAEIPLNLALRANTDEARAEADFDGPVEVAEALKGMVDAVLEQLRLREQTLPPPRPLRVKARDS